MDDLQQLRPLQCLIKRELQRLEDLRDSLWLHGPKLDGLPHAPGTYDKIGSVIPDIIDQENETAERLKQYYAKKNEIESFINHLPNLRLRLLCQLRFIDGLSWEEVADQVGGKETSYTAKQTVYRYFQRLEKEG